MSLPYRVTRYSQHYADSDMRLAAKAIHLPHLSHPYFKRIEIASHAFLVDSLAGVFLLRVTGREPVKDAPLCMIRGLGDFSGGHVRGDS